jgi:alkaline phosphatase D
MNGFRQGVERCARLRRDVDGPHGTLPVGRTDKLDLAFACCQLYQGGYFNAFAAISAIDQLDAVLHLGDYIYEYGTDYSVYGGAVAERVPDPPHETVTLADYRARHA